MAMTEERLKKLERVHPTVINVVLLDEIAGRLSDLQETISKTIPQGIAESISITIEANKKQQVKPPTPWFNFSLYNKVGSDTVYVAVNKRGADPHPVEEDETYNCNMGAAKIECIYLWCDSGNSAEVKISAMR